MTPPRPPAPAASEPAPPAASARSSAFYALREHSDFRFLWAGDIFFNAAQWLEFITVGWLALKLSGSSLHSVLTVGIRAAPLLVVGPWAGVMADRWDRRRVAFLAALLTGGAGLAFALALAWAGQAVTIVHVYAYMLLSGVGGAVAQPVRQALLANTVPRADLENAFALNAMTVTSMRLGGTLLGGVLIEHVPFHWNFVVGGGMALAAGLLVLPMRLPYREAARGPALSVGADLVAGLRYLVRHRLVFRLILLNLTRTALFVPLLMLLPAYTRDVLGAGASMNVAMTVSMGVGGVLATFLISARGFFTTPGLVCLLTLISGSAVILTLGLAPWAAVAVPVMLAMGLSQTHFIVSNLTLIQGAVPDAFRGRISSLWHYQQGLVFLFAAAIGLLAAAVGLRATLVIMGGTGCALGLAYLARYQDVRRS